MKKNIFVLALCLGLGFVVVSCGNDEVPPLVFDQVDAQLEFQMRVGSDALVEGETYTFGDTAAMRVDVARFYLGNITLSQDSSAFTEESSITFPSYNVVSPENTNFDLGTVDAGTYNFAFGVGVDPINNDQSTNDFATRSENDPLGAQVPEMHWNWNSGYKFLRIDGVVDTDNDGIVDTPVQYHIGSNPFFSIQTNSQTVDLQLDDREISLRFDLEKLLDGVDIRSGGSTHVADSIELAEVIFDNYSQAFSLQN